MNTALKKVLKEYAKYQSFTSAAAITEAIKKILRDVICTVTEVELDKGAGSAPNCRNNQSMRRKPQKPGCSG